MIRSIAPLVYYDHVDSTYIKIGTGSWLHWLAQNKSFRYESFWGSFIACKEQQGEETFWIAYRRVKEQQRSADLGFTEDLTVENLLDTAKKLSASNTRPWDGKHPTPSPDENPHNQSETIPQGIELNAARQWCIFYIHPDGREEFLGASWKKEQALNYLQNLLALNFPSELISSLPGNRSNRYEVREELVIPIGYTQTRLERNSFGFQASTQEIELRTQVSQLRQQISKLQRQLDQERHLNSKFIWN
ncbi:hypothetical protein [Allocoleopsis franciscana]|uniref:Uncharacterized protein n=1 Tax=Allocoleopsis franciscana PCC 7113 TaxID=1173027 RepID=K9W9Y5_9CYAN|nr:hypothetical protein [Allocoleopsis franciscana]AFZ16332.1 hypothetical protein Mic7113_0412 [Allocoleopsis franciscana PCC 7113]